MNVMAGCNPLFPLLPLLSILSVSRIFSLPHDVRTGQRQRAEATDRNGGERKTIIANVNRRGRGHDRQDGGKEKHRIREGDEEEDDGTKYTHKHNTHRITNMPASFLVPMRH